MCVRAWEAACSHLHLFLKGEEAVHAWILESPRNRLLSRFVCQISEQLQQKKMAAATKAGAVAAGIIPVAVLVADDDDGIRGFNVTCFRVHVASSRCLSTNSANAHTSKSNGTCSISSNSSSNMRMQRYTVHAAKAPAAAAATGRYL